MSQDSSVASDCVCCKSRQVEHVLTRQDRLGEQSFRYQRCCQCGLIRLDPLLSAQAKAAYYPPNYAAFREPRSNWLLEWGQRWYWGRRVHAVGRWFASGGGRVLDVGCATGGFLAAMRRCGWQVSGLEPNAGAAARASQRLGAGVVQTLHLAEADFPPETFDLITLWDVLDHVPDPPAALCKLRGWLRPAGLLVLGVPNPQSWDARLFGAAWLGWDAPRHLYVFTEHTLRAMLAGSGYQVLDARCFYGSYGSWASSLDHILRSRLAQGRLRRSLRWLAGRRSWRYLLWPCFRLAERANRGPIRVYFCCPTA